MREETNVGGKRGTMPPTSWSLVLAAREDASSDAWNELLTRYWKPVYKYIRLAWNKSNEEAKDLTQGYLTTFFEKGFLSQFNEKKGRFRTFVRASLDNFLRNAARHDRAVKRGGREKIISMNAGEAETELNLVIADPNKDLFDAEWAHAVMQNALGRLHQKYKDDNKENHFIAFHRYYIEEEDVTYKVLAEELGVKENDLANMLQHSREQFRGMMDREILDTVDSDGAFHQEVRDLFGGKRP